MSEQPAPGKRSGGSALHEPWLTPGRLFALVAVGVGAWAAVVVVRALREVFTMLLVAVFLSFAMEPAVQYLARRGWRRGWATGGVFLVVIAISSLVVTTMAQFLVDQAVRLVRDFPAFVVGVGDLLQRLPFVPELEAPGLQERVVAYAEEFGGRLGDVALGAAGNVIALGATALGVIARTLAVLLITFYLVADGPRFRRTLARPLPPDQQREMLAIWEMAVAKTGGYMYSRLLIGAVSAAVHGVAMLVLDIPFAFALALWMGLLTAFIPILGVPLGGLLLLVAAFVHEPSAALWLLIVILIYQQIENYVLGPKVQAHVMDLHPAVAFMSVIVGATLLGAVGALLALPAAAITKALLSTYVRRHELIEELHDVEIRLELEDDVERGRGTAHVPASIRWRRQARAERAAGTGPGAAAQGEGAAAAPAEHPEQSPPPQAPPTAAGRRGSVGPAGPVGTAGTAGTAGPAGPVGRVAPERPAGSPESSGAPEPGGAKEPGGTAAPGVAGQPAGPGQPVASRDPAGQPGASRDPAGQPAGSAEPGPHDNPPRPGPAASRDAPAPTPPGETAPRPKSPKEART